MCRDGYGDDHMGGGWTAEDDDDRLGPRQRPSPRPLLTRLFSPGGEFYKKLEALQNGGCSVQAAAADILEKVCRVVE